MFGLSAEDLEAASDVASDVHLYGGQMGISEDEEPLFPASMSSQGMEKYIVVRLTAFFRALPEHCLYTSSVRVLFFFCITCLSIIHKI